MTAELLCRASFLSRCEPARALGRFPSVSAWSAGRTAPLRSASLRSKPPRCPLLRASFLSEAVPIDPSTHPCGPNCRQAALKNLEIHKVFLRFFAFPAAIFPRKSAYFGYWYSFSRCEPARTLGRFPSVSAWSAGRTAPLRSASLRSKPPRCPLLRASYFCTRWMANPDNSCLR